MLNRLEYATDGETFFDFCLWEYTPVTAFEGKLRPASLLFQSFDYTGIDLRAFELVEAIRDKFGVSNTVWGIKKFGKDIFWEFYFYDYRKRERRRSVAKFKDIVHPFADCEVPLDEDTAYFMFSIDIDEALVTGSRDLDEIHIYIGNTGSTISSGIAYSVKAGGIRLENLYYFFDAKEQKGEIANKAASSAYFQDTRTDIRQIIWPELRDCGVIVVANKQNNDSVYFSRINVDQFIYFLRRMDYPDEICRFIEEHRAELDHLLYDVGFDYRMEDNRLVILKSGYYGIF
ncbi:MAG: hypothetical protein PVI79_12205 [Gammaproteobacteria bacterium]|jgi:hypothetical protein